MEHPAKRPLGNSASVSSALGEDDELSRERPAEGSSQQRPCDFRKRKGSATGSSILYHAIRSGERDYVRKRDLPGLLHLFPGEIEAMERRSPFAIFQSLTRAIRAERIRGRSGHWRYSLTRHIGLRQALAAERLRFQAPEEERGQDSKRQP
ncbi:DUF6477 family protein [uncultured Cohaesibacter sp.]|uniref:DUF6477 family protein n=1 Tax=uncultured Cohaesibacter sp. TaxID=1002546 RepID=UPI0029309F65|nr:DUF6477 family protein [uncultured Cohaesibacter sp.]